jgi:hypothetical protein
MGEKINECKIFVGKPEGKIHLGKIDAEERIILKELSKTQNWPRGCAAQTNLPVIECG